MFAAVFAAALLLSTAAPRLPLPTTPAAFAVEASVVVAVLGVRQRVDLRRTGGSARADGRARWLRAAQAI